MNQIWQNKAHWPSDARLAEYHCHRMAKLLGTTLRQVERHFHDVMKMKATAYLHDLRMKDAEILLHSKLRVFEISTLLGYGHPEHFARAFKKHFGRPPTRVERRRDGSIRALEADAFLHEYCRLLEDEAAKTDDADEKKRLRARIPYS